MQAIRGYPVNLVQGDHAAIQAQQPEYLQVFPGLRHDAVVGGDDEKRVLLTGYPGDHVVHEAVMAGHVDETDPVRA